MEEGAYITASFSLERASSFTRFVATAHSYSVITAFLICISWMLHLISIRRPIGLGIKNNLGSLNYYILLPSRVEVELFFFTAVFLSFESLVSFFFFLLYIRTRLLWNIFASFSLGVYRGVFDVIHSLLLVCFCYRRYKLTSHPTWKNTCNTFFLLLQMSGYVAKLERL